MSLFDMKTLNAALDELQEERGISRESVLEAIETALATAYRREYGKRGQIIRSNFDPETGDVEFRQAKIVVDDSLVRMEDEEPASDDDDRSRFNPDQHIMLEDARKTKRGAELDEEISFPLEPKEEFGRIAAQAAKQVILQKIREAERGSILVEFGEREGEVVTGHVQRFERGNLFVDLGRATAILPYEEQIPGERYRQGERIRALLLKVDEGARGAFIKLSRSHPQFLVKLFEVEVPELAQGTVEIKTLVREPGSRAKVAVFANDEHIDPVGSLVGQRGVRVAVVTSELGGEKIDIVEWSENPAHFVEESLKPAEVLDIEMFEDDNRAIVQVAEDQQSLAIGRGGQNVRLAARLTGWKIDIQSVQGEDVASADEKGEEVEIADVSDVDEGTRSEAEKNETSEDEETSESVENENKETEGARDNETPDDETKSEEVEDEKVEEPAEESPSAEAQDKEAVEKKVENEDDKKE